MRNTCYAHHVEAGFEQTNHMPDVIIEGFCCDAEMNSANVRSAVHLQKEQHPQDMPVFDSVTKQIDFEGRLVDPPRIVNCIIDGTVCPVERPADKVDQRLYYNGRKKRHTINYEVVISIVTGAIVWVAGGVPGSMNDISLCRASGVFQRLLPNELILADKGYIGEAAFVTPVRVPNEREWRTNRDLASVRIMVEHVNSRLKVFFCLRNQWRHSLEKHTVVFHLICKIVNIEFTEHPVHIG